MNAEFQKLKNADADAVSVRGNSSLTDVRAGNALKAPGLSRDSGCRRSRATSEELAKWQNLDCLTVLSLVADHVKEDRSFQPRKARGTSRLHVAAAGREWELLTNGVKFYDPRSSSGGGGAVDLAMHLWKCNFLEAVTLLRNKIP